MILLTKNQAFMTPTNDIVWPIVWRRTIEREKEAGLRYINQLFEKLRSDLGMPPVFPLKNDGYTEY